VLAVLSWHPAPDPDTARKPLGWRQEAVLAVIRQRPGATALRISRKVTAAGHPVTRQAARQSAESLVRRGLAVRDDENPPGYHPAEGEADD
jgi:hypothetical protein